MEEALPRPAIIFLVVAMVTRALFVKANVNSCPRLNDSPGADEVPWTGKERAEGESHFLGPEERCE
jgi:hypothetical protein